MLGFMTFTEKDGKSKILVNLDQISTFESYHHLGEGWQFSVMYIGGRRVVVLEDDKDFVETLQKLCGE